MSVNSDGPFPLTPTLFLRKRPNRSLRSRESDASELYAGWRKLL